MVWILSHSSGSESVNDMRVIQYTPFDTIRKRQISIRTDGRLGMNQEKELSISLVGLRNVTAQASKLIFFFSGAILLVGPKF